MRVIDGKENGGKLDKAFSSLLSFRIVLPPCCCVESMVANHQGVVG